MATELEKGHDQISKDRGIDRDLLIDTLEDAVRSSVLRKYGDGLRRGSAIQRRNR